MGLPVANFPQKTKHNLLITMSLDTYLLRPFGWGICLYTNKGNILPDYRHAGSISNNGSKEEYIHLMERFVTKLTECFEFLTQDKSCACIFVYSEQEKTTIQNALLEIISMDDNTISYALQRKVTRCLFNLFENSVLPLVSGSNEDSNTTEVPDIKNYWKEFPRLIILEHAIKENIAIYEPGFYRLNDIWLKLVKPKLSDDQELNSLEERDILSIDLENIHDSWVSKQSSVEEIKKAHLLRNNFGNAVIKAYYELLKESIKDIDSVLIFTPPIFTFTEIKPFNNHYLGKLYFFKQFEAITQCKQIRSSRIKDFTQDEPIRGAKLRFVGEVNNDKTTMKFTVLNNGKMTSLSETTSFYKFILVENDRKVNYIIRLTPI
jgi:DNA replication ATP-dependent helicase Dna2